MMGIQKSAAAITHLLQYDEKIVLNRTRSSVKHPRIKCDGTVWGFRLMRMIPLAIL
jgi:hypothetical protein